MSLRTRSAQLPLRDENPAVGSVTNDSAVRISVAAEPVRIVENGTKRAAVGLMADYPLRVQIPLVAEEVQPKTIWPGTSVRGGGLPAGRVVPMAARVAATIVFSVG